MKYLPPVQSLSSLSIACDATLKVIEYRMKKSDALLFVMSDNSMQSIWCKYELNFFLKLGRPMFFITKEDIDSGSFCIKPLEDRFFVDADYKRLALIEGREITL